MRYGKFVWAAVMLASVLPVLAADPVTFIVSKTADGGTGSLRAAILNANAATYPDAGTNTIAFAIPGAGIHTMHLQSALPEITQSVLIDGYTQPGSSPNTLNTGATNAVLRIELDGGQAGSADGLWFGTGAGASVVRGLVIGGFAGAGIRISATGVIISGNFIGTDASGHQAHGNGVGVEFESIEPYGGPIVGQYDPGPTLYPPTVNVISGNLGAGVATLAINGAVYPPGATIRNNIIGADASGTLALGNGGDGIADLAAGSSGMFAGSKIEHNVVVANGGNGITEIGRGAYIANNLIGVGVGTLGANGPALGNAGDGVHVDGNAAGVSLADQKYTTGFAAGYASIAHNGGAGLWIGGHAMVDVVAQGFYDNGGLGIDMAPLGPNGNDAGDADSGPNERLNSPVLETVSFDPLSGYGDVTGHVDSNPGLAVEVHFYLGDGCDASGYGEGARPLPYDTLSTGTQIDDGAGHTDFTLHSAHLQPGTAITAFTRRVADGTSSIIVSEFSNCLIVPGAEVIFVDGFDGT